MAESASLLKDVRTRLQWSETDCATALGVAAETYRRWEAADDRCDAAADVDRR